MKRLALVLLGGLTALLYRKSLRVEEPLLIEHKKLAWGHFAADVTAEQKRRLAMTAAAPELLQVLYDVKEYLDGTLAPCLPGCDCLCHQVDAAIAKAEGK